MKDSDLLVQAHDLREEAAALLYEAGLFSVIRRTGPTYVIGSFDLDLMTWPDLDLNVELPHDHDVAVFFAVGKEIATAFETARMAFSNWYIRREPFDVGLYWNIRLRYAERWWKIDLWGYGELKNQSMLRDAAALQAQLRAADRTAVLRIKYEVCQRPEYGSSVHSVDIYDAVRRDGVTTVAEFDRWYTNRAAQAQDKRTA